MSKILVVEDDEEYALLIKECLGLDRHNVELCHRGDKALELLLQYSFDAVVLDWQLPGLSGVEVLEKFRMKGGMTPILMLTGLVSVPDKAKGLDAGADDYLAKPAHPQELSARVRALLRRSAGQPTNSISVREFRIDLNKHIVENNGTEIDLLPREYAVIEFFMRNPNHVYSNDEIMNAVWPSDSEASPETVRSCIKRIRQKLDTEGQPSLIRNIYGVGYILDA